MPTTVRRPAAYPHRAQSAPLPSCAAPAPELRPAWPAARVSVSAEEWACLLGLPLPTAAVPGGPAPRAAAPGAPQVRSAPPPPCHPPAVRAPRRALLSAEEWACLLAMPAPDLASAAPRT